MEVTQVGRYRLYDGGFAQVTAIENGIVYGYFERTKDTKVERGYWNSDGKIRPNGVPENLNLYEMV